VQTTVFIKRIKVHSIDNSFDQGCLSIKFYVYFGKEKLKKNIEQQSIFVAGLKPLILVKGVESGKKLFH